MKVTGDMPVVALAGGHKIRVAHIPMEALAPFEPAAVRAFGKKLPELRLNGGITAAEASLMLGGIKDFLIISSPEDISQFKHLFGDGSRLGLKISYAEQPNPGGIAQAFLIGEEYIGKDPVTLILGDNIFYAHKFSDYLKKAAKQKEGGTIFAYHVRDPERYGVVEFDNDRNVLSIEEKPKVAKSPWAVTGLYFYDNHVVDIAKNLRPSARGELEIVDVHNAYLAQGNLQVELLGRGCCWFDTGLYSSLLEAAQFVQTIQTRQATAIACPEEIAFNAKWITAEDVLKLAKTLSKNEYGAYLTELVTSPSWSK